MVSRHYCFSSNDFEDIEQELILAVLDNLNKHDPQKSSMETFVSVLINNKASDLIQYKKLRYSSELPEFQRDDNFESLIDNSIELIDTNHFSIEVINNRDAIDKLEINLSIAKIHKILPKDLSDLFKLLQTTTIDDAVKISKIPRRTIYRRLNKIKAILIENNFEL